MADPELDTIRGVKYEKEERGRPFELTLYLGLAIAIATIGTFVLQGKTQQAFVELTSPFNISLEGNLLGNVAIPLFILACAELYLKATKRDRLVVDIFVSAIAATYIVSVYTLLQTGVIGAGTSIVAFSILLLLLVFMFLDLLKWTKLETEKGKWYNIVWMVLVVAAAVLVLEYGAGTLSVWYIAANVSAVFHIWGGITAAVLTFSIALLRGDRLLYPTGRR